ncbi:hypothetical protein BT96DRAFT_946922 [Gymnopus androsaceus JB14]|uniref:Uncharacterized protein n=1 Tax=Gymnopus androsaceus JB14 TaxID=1447944 RepID=A0A6A4GU52_9AGAR|nr:hypothetical protein BT96DRAFT_946922 [Gymnopus androsaceus JB14]
MTQSTNSLRMDQESKEWWEAQQCCTRGGRRYHPLQMQLGKETEHEVFKGESVGPSLGLELLKKERSVSTVFPMDRQHSGNLSNGLNGIRTQRTTGVEGNEAADEEAKEAAVRGLSPKQLLPHTFRKSFPDE